MIDHTSADFERRIKDAPTGSCHGPKLYPYLRELADEAGLDRSDPLLEQMWLSHSAVIAELPHEFRKFRCERTDAGEFIHEQSKARHGARIVHIQRLV
ncbi:hypothetical protein BV898_15563 [Hypsibius exemplaris]|uniref:Uncharacterized protein n=1 Tax=Hypsibius exemplaris TaxID=2072580 RepID=A0A9X6NE62_HYPEX|nr:hypothetical protein BV898_15563 [Hypsibius exemplaris]